MKISQEFKDIKKPEDVSQEELNTYLRMLYNEPLFDVKDASYVENPDQEFVDGYKRRANILVDELIKLSGEEKFEQFRPHFTQIASVGDTRDIIDIMKKSAEAICYNLANEQVVSMNKFKAAVKSAIIECTPGAASNMQKILYEMRDSPYYQKYAYIQKLAAQYMVAKKLSRGEVYEEHVGNELIHEASEAYKVVPPKDIYARYRQDLKATPEPEMEHHPGFVVYLDEHFASRAGVYSFVELIANDHLSTLPDNDKPGKKFSSYKLDQYGNVIYKKTKEGWDLPVISEDMEKINRLSEALGIPVTSIVELSEDESEFSYKEDYISIIKAATILAFQKGELIDQQPLENISRKEKTISGVAMKGKDGKMLKDESGKPRMLYKKAKVEMRERIIESPDGWYLVDDKTNYTKLFDFNKIRDLTIGGQNIEDWLHNSLKPLMDLRLGFDGAMHVVIERRLQAIKVDLSKTPIVNQLMLLSDQARSLDGIMTLEEILAIPPQDLNSWSEFAKLKDNLPKALKFAVQCDNLQMLRKYQKLPGAQYTDFTTWSDYGHTLLHLAVKDNKPKVIPFLIATGIYVDAVNRNGETPLHSAVHNNSTKLVELLLNERAYVNVVNRDGETLLHSAAKSGNAEVVEMLLLKGKAYVHVVNRDGETPLHSAAKSGNAAVVKILLGNGADLNAVNRDGGTPLHSAAGRGKAEVVKILLEERAYVNAVNKYGYTPLHHAASSYSEEVVVALLKAGADPTIKGRDKKTAAEMKPNFFTNEKIIKILKEAIMEGDEKAIVNLDKSFSHLKDKKFGLLSFLNIKLHDKHDKKTISMAAHMVDLGFDLDIVRKTKSSLAEEERKEHIAETLGKSVQVAYQRLSANPAKLPLPKTKKFTDRIMKESRDDINTR